jgi:hypothetical protein
MPKVGDRGIRTRHDAFMHCNSLEKFLPRRRRLDPNLRRGRLQNGNVRYLVAGAYDNSKIFPELPLGVVKDTRSRDVTVARGSG